MPSQPDNWRKVRRGVIAATFVAMLAFAGVACGNNGGIPTTPPLPTPTPKPCPSTLFSASPSTQCPRPNALQSPVAFSPSTPV